MFEEVVKSYLLNEPVYKNLYDDVWLLSEVPAEYHIPKKDLGVDLVARHRDSDELTAVQAKYYHGKVGKDTINSYVAELNKNYYADGLLVATTDDWNKNAEAALDDGCKDINRIGLSDLKHSSFDWSQFSFGNAEKAITASHKQPRAYQNEAIDKTVAYFDEHERGKLIMAPGTGKTFTSLKIAEAMAANEQKQDYFVLYLVPSIQLLSQTLFSWDKALTYAKIDLGGAHRSNNPAQVRDLGQMAMELLNLVDTDGIDPQITEIISAHEIVNGLQKIKSHQVLGKIVATF